MLAGICLSLHHHVEHGLHDTPPRERPDKPICGPRACDTQGPFDGARPCEPLGPSAKANASNVCACPPPQTRASGDVRQPQVDQKIQHDDNAPSQADGSTAQRRTKAEQELPAMANAATMQLAKLPRDHQGLPDACRAFRIPSDCPERILAQPPRRSQISGAKICPGRSGGMQGNASGGFAFAGAESGLPRWESRRWVVLRVVGNVANGFASTHVTHSIRPCEA